MKQGCGSDPQKKNEAIVSDIIDGRWTCNSQDSEGLVQPISGGPAHMKKCPKCNSDAIVPCDTGKIGRFEVYQEIVGCEDCGALYTIHYSVAFKAFKITNNEA